eukprot:TRINITY_DN3807_c0_g2_i7.p1 TRINITY_DN3807_c0_g2~~TRINITY_DN3807_c0_g2_i7.p1  ORF type:complete len:793 (+),score=233.62 TRINITY_DN3807_c0_g2_i7:109-2487(+)
MPPGGVGGARRVLTTRGRRPDPAAAARAEQREREPDPPRLPAVAEPASPARPPREAPSSPGPEWGRLAFTPPVAHGAPCGMEGGGAGLLRGGVAHAVGAPPTRTQTMPDMKPRARLPVPPEGSGGALRRAQSAVGRRGGADEDVASAHARVAAALRLLDGAVGDGHSPSPPQTPNVARGVPRRAATRGLAEGTAAWPVAIRRGEQGAEPDPEAEAEVGKGSLWKRLLRAPTDARAARMVDGALTVDVAPTGDGIIGPPPRAARLTWRGERRTAASTPKPAAPAAVAAAPERLRIPPAEPEPAPPHVSLADVPVDVLRNYLLPYFDLAAAVHGSRVCVVWREELAALGTLEREMMVVTHRVGYLVKTKVAPALDAWNAELEKAAGLGAKEQLQFWATHHDVLSKLEQRLTQPATRLELKAVMRFATDYELKRLLREFHTSAAVTSYLAKQLAPIRRQHAQLHLLADAWPGGGGGAIDARYPQWFLASVTPEIAASIRVLLDEKRFGEAHPAGAAAQAPPVRRSSDPDRITALLLSTSSAPARRGVLRQAGGAGAPDAYDRPPWCKPGEAYSFPRVVPKDHEVMKPYLRTMRDGEDGGAERWTDRFAAAHLFHLAVCLSGEWVEVIQNLGGEAFALSDVAAVHYERCALEEFMIAIDRAAVALSDWQQWIVDPLLAFAPSRDLRSTLTAHKRALTYTVSVLADVKDCAKALDALPARPPPPPSPFALTATVTKTVAALEAQYKRPNVLAAAHQAAFAQLKTRFKGQVRTLGAYLAQQRQNAALREGIMQAIEDA